MATFAAAPQPVGPVLDGNFEIQALYADSSGISLALVAVGDDGRDDLRNWISISLSDEDGVSVARAHNCVNGRSDVFTPGTQKQNALRSVALDGSYSVPFTSTDRQLKILRNDVSGYFHLYAGVCKEIAGQSAQGWVELTPTADPSTNTKEKAAHKAVFFSWL